MNPTVKAILADLYALDPSLKNDEAKIVPIIEKLLAHRPDATPDDAFVQQLRMMLRDHATELSEPSTSFFSTLFSMNRYVPAVVGALLGVVITGPLVYTFVNSDSSTFAPTDDATMGESLFSFNVSPTSKRAFGDLDEAQSAATGMGGGGDMAGVSRQQSGGGGTEMASNPVSDVDGKLIAPDIYPPFEWVNYKLAFDGEIPALPGANVDVLKRIKRSNSTDASRFLGAMNLGVINLGAFEDAKVDSLTLYQDKEYGYYVNVNLREGTVFLNQQWERWPHPESNCQTEDCFNRYRLTPDQIPSDEELISIARAFVTKYDIDMAQYGEPEVDNAWRTQYATATDKSMVYVPESPRVIFPLMIDGKPVYEEGGQKFGLSIGVNARAKRVSDAWGMMDHKYQSSTYAGVTDEAAIRNYIAAYGTFPADTPMPMERMMIDPMPNTTSRDVTITLGTPTLGYVKAYKYTNNTTDELIVPALIFPIANVPEGEHYYGSSITIPLAQELFDQANQGIGPIMPLM